MAGARRIALDVWDLSSLLTASELITPATMRRLWGSGGSKDSHARRWERWKADLRRHGVPHERVTGPSEEGSPVHIRLAREARDWAAALLDAYESRECAELRQADEGLVGGAA